LCERKALRAGVARKLHDVQQQKLERTKLIMNHSANDAAVAGLGLAMILVLLIIGLAFYLFYCFCAKRICEKCGVNPGILIWIPIVNFIPLLQVAKMAVWMIILFFIPIANLVVGIMMWAKICTARGKSPWLVIMFFIPIVNLVFLPYLAFSE
jgi:uncharacterized membrane protein YhaH (DUF805 family)